jgi:hypothetical protein
MLFEEGLQQDEPGTRIIGDLESSQLYDEMYLAFCMTGASSSIKSVFTSILVMIGPKGAVESGG